MPRKPLFRTDVLPYHVCARTNNRVWFNPDGAAAWAMFCENLHEIFEKYQIWIHAFVLMSNHFHMITSTPLKNLDQGMLYLMREVSKSMNRSSGNINHTFGGPYKWSVISNAFQYAHALKYVYRNPVVAGMCSQVEDYPFSSLRSLLVPGVLNVPVVGNLFEKHPLLGATDADFLGWMNEPYSEEERLCVKAALRRRRFRFLPVNRHHRLPETLDGQLIPPT